MAYPLPELLAAIDRRAQERVEAESVTAARLARAEAHVMAIVVDRTRELFRSETRRGETETMLRAVATHELDPFAAADRLLDRGTDRD